MAYVLSSEEEDQNKEQSANEGKALGAESGIITEDQQKSQGTQNGTGNYTNLQSYLDQNKEAGFGSQFAGSVGERVTGAEEAQRTSGEEFRSKANQGAVEENSSLVQEAATSPTKIVNDAGKLAEFRRQQSAQYKGPKNLSDEEELYLKAYNPTNAAESQAKQAQTASGQKTLLGEYYGAPAQRYGYSSGQKNLDQILIGMDPTSRAQLDQQRQRATQAKSNFGALEGQLSDYAKQKEQSTNKAREGVEATLNPARAQWQQVVTNRVNKQLQGRDADVARINNAIKNRQGEQLTESDRALLGLDLNQPLFKIGSDSGVVNPNLNANLNTLATQEEYDTADAYATLANEQNTFLTGKPGVGSLYTPTTDLGALQTSRAKQWADIVSGKGSGQDLAKWNYGPGGPGFVNAETQGLNIFNPDEAAEIDRQIGEQQRLNPALAAQMRAQVESQRQRLMNDYGALDYALQSAKQGSADAKRISNARFRRY